MMIFDKVLLSDAGTRRGGLTSVVMPPDVVNLDRSNDGQKADEVATVLNRKRFKKAV